MASIIIYKEDGHPTYTEFLQLLATCSTEVEHLHNTPESITLTLDGEDSGFEDVRNLFTAYRLGGDEACDYCGQAMPDGYCPEQQRHEDLDRWPDQWR